MNMLINGDNYNNAEPRLYQILNEKPIYFGGKTRCKFGFAVSYQNKHIASLLMNKMQAVKLAVKHLNERIKKINLGLTYGKWS